MSNDQETALVERKDQPERALSAFSSSENFQTAQRMAKALIASSLVPEEYRGEKGVANTLIAMELANRIGASPLMVMQNLDVIYERPAWRSTFLIATVNASGRFGPLRFRFEGEPGTDEWGCRAYAKDLETEEECEGTLITIQMAKDEGWYEKKGSKWKTMPEQMLRYRAAAFWSRTYAPELSLGMYTTDEVADFEGAGTGRSTGANSLNEALETEGVQIAEVVDESTGEILDEDDGSPPTKSQVDQLRELMDKADVGFDEAGELEKSIKAEDGPAVRQAIRDLNKRLLGGQGDLLGEEG